MTENKKDYAILAFISVCSQIPGVSLFSNYISGHLQIKENQKQKKAIEYLGKRLARLESEARLDDLDNLNPDEVLEIFKINVLTIFQTYQDIKIKAAINIITNTLLKTGDGIKLKFSELDHYSRCLDSLSAGAIEVLGHAVLIAKNKPNREYVNQVTRFNFSDLKELNEDKSPHFLMALVAELNSFNLIHFQSTPSIATTDYSNYPLELTPVGTKFVEYILNLDENSD